MSSYDSWKLATPPEYEMTSEQEFDAQIKERNDLIAKLEEALDDIVQCGVWVNHGDGVTIDWSAYENAKRVLRKAQASKFP